MKRVLKVLVVLMLLGFVGFSLTAWWFLHWDKIEAPDLPGVVQEGSLQHEGRQRSWISYVPRSLADKPALVLIMHGSLGSSEDMRKQSFYSFDVAAERGGFIAVYPQGYDKHWNDCRGSATYMANRLNVDDVGFLSALVDEMKAKYAVDPGRVFATGFSNGGHMAYRLGLETPELVRGIAAIAANIPETGNLDCEPSSQSVATLIINGTADPINPYEGGLVEILGDVSRGSVYSAQESAGYWAELAGHSGEGEQNSWPDKVLDDDTTISSSTWSAPGRQTVQLVTVHGGGHNLPHPVFSLPRISGATSHEFDGADFIWQFFDQLDAY